MEECDDVKPESPRGYVQDPDASAASQERLGALLRRQSLQVCNLIKGMTAKDIVEAAEKAPGKNVSLTAAIQGELRAL